MQWNKTRNTIYAATMKIDKYWELVFYKDKYTYNLLKTTNKYVVKLVYLYQMDYPYICEYSNMTYKEEIAKKFVTRIKEHEKSQILRDNKSAQSWKQKLDRRVTNNKLWQNLREGKLKSTIKLEV